MEKTLDSILIVDDEKDNLEALRRLLRNQYEVTLTDSPFAALKAMQKQRFNVIVSDQRMPEMSGVELLEKARNVSPASVRILLTGYTDIESVIGAINRGNIYRYVAKPWDPEDLKLTLRQANEAYHLRRELDLKNEALEKSNAELKLLDKAKGRFLQLVSHELNTPLTVLNAFIGLLAEKKAGFPPDVEKAIGSLSSASARFTEIVNDVLTYVRLESGSEFHPGDVDLRKAAEAARETLKDELARRKVKLTVTGKGKTIARCDPAKIQAALERLFSDACARSPEGEEIKVLVEADGSGRVACTVKRKGEAVSAEAFLPLQTAAEEKHHHRNLGLGLAICRLIAQGSGGDLALDSKTGSGTGITLSLPAA